MKGPGSTKPKRAETADGQLCNHRTAFAIVLSETRNSMAIA